MMGTKAGMVVTTTTTTTMVKGKKVKQGGKWLSLSKPVIANRE